MAKQIPGRMCIGCRTVRPKNELLRVIRTPEGQITFDRTGKQNGRGAYICEDEGCLGKAFKQKALKLALKCEIPEEVYNELKSMLLPEEKS